MGSMMSTSPSGYRVNPQPQLPNFLKSAQEKLAAADKERQAALAAEKESNRETDRLWTRASDLRQKLEAEALENYRKLEGPIMRALSVIREKQRVLYAGFNPADDHTRDDQRMRNETWTYLERDANALEAQQMKLWTETHPAPLYTLRYISYTGAYDVAVIQYERAKEAEKKAAAKVAKANQAWKDAQAEAAWAALLDATAKAALDFAPKVTSTADGPLVARIPDSLPLANNEIRIAFKQQGKKVEIALDGGGYQEVNEGQTLPVGKTVKIHTGYKSNLVVELAGGKKLEIKPMTLIELHVDKQGRVTVDLSVGELKAEINKMGASRADMEVGVPTATASVRGTIFIVAYNPKTKTGRITVIEHKVLVTPANRALRPVLLKEGQWVEVSPIAITAPATSPATLAAAETARLRRSQTARR